MSSPKRGEHPFSGKQAGGTGENKMNSYGCLFRGMVEKRRSPGTLICILLSALLLVVLLSGLLTACSPQQTASDQAGTATQDPPVPQLTKATHGILDTTGAIPSDFLNQLRVRSDDVQAHGYQMAVVFFNNLANDPHQFATAVFNQNGIGFQDTNNGVLFVLFLQKSGTDGHKPWLTYLTGGGISTALPDTLMDDYVQATFVPARAQGQWQSGLLTFYDRVSAAEQDPTIAKEWQTHHPGVSSNSENPSASLLPILILVATAFIIWLGISAIVATRQKKNFFLVAFTILGRFLLILFWLSRNARSSSSNRDGGGFGSWGGGGRSPSSGGNV